MTNEKLSAEKQLALIRYALTTAQKVYHARFCDPHPLGQAEVCKATSEAITLLDGYSTTVRKEQIAQDIQLAKDVWEDGLKDEHSALQMKEWIVNALTRQDYDALQRVRQEEREAAGQIAFAEAVRQGISAERAIAIKTKINRKGEG